MRILHPVCGATWLILAAELFVAADARAAFANALFATGNASVPPPSWNISDFTNSAFTPQTPQTLAGLNLHPGGAAQTILLAAASPLTQSDADLGAAATLRWPRFGTHCVIINQHGDNENVNMMWQNMTIGPGDIDPHDGQVHVRLVFAPVFQNPMHALSQSPYGYIELDDLTTGKTLYSNFILNNAGYFNNNVPWKSLTAGGVKIDYTDWQLAEIAPGGAVSMGDQVTVRFIASGCSLGGHWGEMYVASAQCVPPGIFVTGTAVLDNALTCTYSLVYRNGGAVAESGVALAFTTPPNTTFLSVNAPGISILTPAVGSSGVVNGTIGTLAAGGSGSITVTVNIAPGGSVTNLVAGNYQISSTQETPLIGPPIITSLLVTAPVAITSAASAISLNAATLNGTVNPRGSATLAYFQYGTTTAYGSFSPTNSLPAAYTSLGVSSGVSGLLPGTTYHFQIVAVNNAGTSVGADQTFATSLLPGVATGAATVLTSALLTGTVNPSGGPALAYFQYGTDTTYGSFSATNTLTVTNLAQPVSALVTGLATDTLYHFQLVAVGAAGTALGADQAFNTCGVALAGFAVVAGAGPANGGFQMSFTNLNGSKFTVLTSTSLTLPLNDWTGIGAPSNTGAGQYQFTDPAATNSGQRFYRIRSP